MSALATAQGGNVTRAQLLAAGLSKSGVTRWIRAGRLIPRFRGMYAVAHLATGERGLLHAALLAVGDDAALSHRTAAQVLGYVGGSSREIDVLVARRGGRSRAGLRVHETIVAFERRTVDGLPVTAPLRTLRDFATVASPRELAAACSEALVRGHVAQAELDRSGIVGPGDVAPTKGAFERRLFVLLRQAGLPRPEINRSVMGFVPDYLWPAERLIVEADGYSTHGHRAAFEADRARDAELAAAGWIVMRVTWRQLSESPMRTMTRLAQALARRG